MFALCHEVVSEAAKVTGNLVAVSGASADNQAGRQIAMSGSGI